MKQNRKRVIEILMIWIKSLFMIVLLQYAKVSIRNDSLYQNVENTMHQNKK